MADNDVTTRSIKVQPELVPENESGQTVTYSLTPSTSDLLEVEFNSETGEVKVSSMTGMNGSVEFTVTADDGEQANNTDTNTFTVTVVDAIKEPTINGVNVTPDQDQSSSSSSMSIGVLVLLMGFAILRRQLAFSQRLAGLRSIN